VDDPIETLAYKIAYSLKRWNPDITDDIEVIRCGAAYYINYYSVIFLTLIFGFITHRFLDSVLTLLSFGIIRRYTGGIHLKSLTACMVFTVFVLSIIPLIPLNHTLAIILNLVSMIIVTVKRFKTAENKLMSLLLHGTNLIYGSPIVSICFLIQTVQLIKGGEAK
jgi:accessory gene regulator B